MKSRYLKILIILVLLPAFQACEDLLNIEQQGSVAIDTFYETDEDALEAIAAVYFTWRGMQYNDFFLKNLLSDDVIAGGGSRGDNSEIEAINEYRFTPENSLIEGYFTNAYTLIYRATLIIENYPSPETAVQRRVIAEAKIARAWAYINLVSMWGEVPLVTTILSGDSEFQTNTPTSETWAQIEADLTEAIESGALPQKTTAADAEIGARLTVHAAMAFLGKAYLYQEKYSQAADVLGDVIDSELYELIDDYENILTASQDFGAENIFELNSLLDENNPFNQGNTLFAAMMNWRVDRISNWWMLGLSYQGWGFANPSKDLYDAFVAEEGDESYRMQASLKTYNWLSNPVFPGITVNSGSYVYGNEGFFPWKNRVPSSEVITTSYGFTAERNYRIMRYAEVLLMAAEASLQSGDASAALTYINEVRTRAQLENLPSVTMADIKIEKRLELCMEGVRFQDMVRWGEAAAELANQGATIPVFYGFDGSNNLDVRYDQYTNTIFGFKTGKHELLPFPQSELNINPNLTQNPGW